MDSIIGPSVSVMSERGLTNIRNEKLGFVFEFFNLIPTLSAVENVALLLQFACKRKFKPEGRSRELLSHLGLGNRLNHRPHQLSGDQQPTGFDTGLSTLQSRAMRLTTIANDCIMQIPYGGCSMRQCTFVTTLVILLSVSGCPPV